MGKISAIFLIITLAAVLYLLLAPAPQVLPRSYTGVGRCRACHEPASIGNQFDQWRSGPHAGAYQALESEKALAYLEQNNKTTSGCLNCHTTLRREARNESEQLLMAEGVGCEACHGPASDYALYEIMIDSTAFVRAGGMAGSLEDCYSCHATDPATVDYHCPFQTEPFDAELMWQQIRHPLPQDVDADTLDVSQVHDR